MVRASCNAHTLNQMVNHLVKYVQRALSDFFVYIYVSNYGQRRLQPAAREQCYAANYADLQTPMCLVRAVRHFLIIVDELMNETKWIL